MPGCPHPPSRWRHPSHVLSPASRRRWRRGRSQYLDPVEAFPPLQEPHPLLEPHPISRPPRREPQAALCPHPYGVPLRHSRPLQSPRPLLPPSWSQGESRQAGQHPSSVWAAESTKSQDRFSGQYPFSSPPAGTSKRTSPSSGGGRAGEGGSEGVIPNSLPSYTLLSGPTSHWSFDTGPFLVLR